MDSRKGQVIGGEYGSGKSHIELVLYHLFDSPELGRQWLNQQGIDVDIPDDTRSAALQMFNLDQEYNRLSAAVGDYLGIDEWADDTDLPTVHQIRDALEDTPTIILIDEFERWFGMAKRADYRDDNLAFLQNLLEAAGRDDTHLSVLISLLYENDDVQAITQRTNPFHTICPLVVTRRSISSCTDLSAKLTIQRVLNHWQRSTQTSTARTTRSNSKITRICRIGLSGTIRSIQSCSLC